MTKPGNAMSTSETWRISGFAALKKPFGESDIVTQEAEIRRDAAEAQGFDATPIREQPPAEKNDVVTHDDDGKRTVSSVLS